MDEKENSKQKIKITSLAGGTALFVLAAFLVFALWAYRFSDLSQERGFLHKHIFLPGIIMGGTNFISIGEINQNILSIKKFYESQDFSDLGLRVDFSTDDGKKRLKIREKELINKMIEDKAIEILANERGINISSKIVDENVQRKLDEYGGESEIKNSLDKLYGWNMSEFKDKIVQPSLYKDELTKWVAENDGKEKNETAQKDSQEAKARLDGGESFETVAEEISKGGTANSGGKLGWFLEEQISTDISQDVVALKKGEVSGILESKLGYHIIKLDNTRENSSSGEDGAENSTSQEAYEISQIFFPKFSFANWLDGKIKGMKVWVLMMDYKWDKETGLVEFKNNDMQKFEAEILEKSQADPSMLSF